MGELPLRSGSGQGWAVCEQEGCYPRSGTSPNSAPKLPSEPLQRVPESSQVKPHLSWSPQTGTLLLSTSQIQTMSQAINAFQENTVTALEAIAQGIPVRWNSYYPVSLEHLPQEAPRSAWEIKMTWSNGHVSWVNIHARFISEEYAQKLNIPSLGSFGV